MTGPDGFPQGYDFRHFSEIDSTNEEARRLAGDGVDGPLWIMAERQTAGRGRQGRQWVSQFGNLMTTCLLRPDCDLDKMGQIGFVAGLALQSCVAEMAGIEAKLKWPNDVLLEGAKCSGILLETLGENSNGQQRLAVGIGLNLKSFPPDTPYPAISVLAATGCEIEPLAALARLAHYFDRFYQMWDAEGFAALREDWLSHAHGLDAPVNVQLADRTVSGILRSIDADGQLLVENEQGKTHIITAGDVYFPEG